MKQVKVQCLVGEFDENKIQSYGKLNLLIGSKTVNEKLQQNGEYEDKLRVLIGTSNQQELINLINGEVMSFINQQVPPEYVEISCKAVGDDKVEVIIGAQPVKEMVQQYWMMFQQYGVDEITNKVENTISLSIEMNQNMKQLADILNDTNSFGCGFLDKLRVNFAINVDPQVPQLFFDSAFNKQFIMMPNDVSSVFNNTLSNFNGMDLEIEYDSIKEMPEQFQKFVLSIPKSMGDKNKRLINEDVLSQLPFYSQFQSLLLSQANLQIHLKDIAYIELDLKSEETSYFIQNFFGFMF